MDGASDGLPIDTNPADLGAIVHRVLRIAFDAPPLRCGHSEFDDQLGRRFGLKNGSSLYAGVRSVGLDEDDGWFTCTPMRHLRGFNWEAFPPVWKDQQPLRVPSDASDEAWGATALAALRLSV